jgi:hypothetical protein
MKSIRAGLTKKVKGSYNKSRLKKDYLNLIKHKNKITQSDMQGIVSATVRSVFPDISKLDRDGRATISRIEDEILFGVDKKKDFKIVDMIIGTIYTGYKIRSRS